MKAGDVLDPVALGHTAVDVKKLITDAGYIVPKTSVGKLAEIPAEVKAEVARIEATQKQYERLDEPAEFVCKDCGTHNGSQWRRDTVDGTEFLVCGECNRVAKVR